MPKINTLKHGLFHKNNETFSEYGLLPQSHYKHKYNERVTDKYLGSEKNKNLRDLF